MTYEACLQMIQKAADERKLGIKTYCLLYLECLTVPEAVEKLMAATEKMSVRGLTNESLLVCRH